MQAMKSNMQAMRLLTLAAALCAGCQPSPRTFPKEGTLVVVGGDVSAPFAAQELNAIVMKAAGYEFATNDVFNAARKIYVGRSAEVEKALGVEFLDGLQDEESVVVARGDDLFLVGGGALGTLWATYDFLEDHLGYRCYFMNGRGEIGDVWDRTDVVTFKGAPSRRIPAFRGYRQDHHNMERRALFETRNRSNSAARRFVKGYEHPMQGFIGGHGFCLLVPAEDPNPAYGIGKLGIKGAFKDHPEWFSLGSDGQRDPRAQLCLSNPECRKVLFDRVCLRLQHHGGRGAVMVGSNDNHNDRYCWCDGCVALEKKYNSIGGPLWDWILEYSPKLKEAYPEAYITSLAYKGWRQTEVAPSGVERFPDNFICDAAFLNADRELAKVFDENTPEGAVFNRLENLKKWCGLCRHVSYWYYGGSNPALVHTRIQKEFIELRDAGVESIGLCGHGGGHEFGDMTYYIAFKLMQDPHYPIRRDVERMFSIKYGPAAAKVLAYADALDACREKAIGAIKVTTGTDDPFAGFSYLSGADILSLRKLADEALARAEGTEYERAVKESRMGLNIWTLSFFHKVKQADPAAAAKIDLAALDAETREAGIAFVKRNFAETDRDARPGNNPVVRALDEFANYATLKSDVLPAELKDVPAESVFRILPPKRMPYYCGGTQRGMSCDADPLAASGWAWYDKVEERFNKNPKGLNVVLYDTVDRLWILSGEKAFIPKAALKKDGYTLYKLGRFPIPSGFQMIFADLWGFPTNIRGPRRLFDPSYVNKVWDIWVSIRAQGPKFIDGDVGENAFWIDQVFCVDRGVPEGK